MDDLSSPRRNAPEPDSDTELDPSGGLAGTRPTPAQSPDATGAELDRLARDLEAARSLLRIRQRELERLRATTAASLHTLRHQVQAVADSGAWRYGHLASRLLTRLRRRHTVTQGGVVAALGQIDRTLELLGASQPDAAPPDPMPPTERNTEAAGRLGEAIRRRLGPTLDAGLALPAVSLVVTSRSAGLIEGFLGLVSSTDYPDVEVVVVDNASPRGEVQQAVEDSGLPRIASIRLETAAGFARANNQGADLATGDVLVFLNDDVRALEPGWLRELVRTGCEPGAGVVGATLVTAGPDGPTIEQRGIALGFDSDGYPAPQRREAGVEPLSGGFGVDLPAVAVSAACLLIPRSTFRRLGGFDDGYQYGFEDLDLCLRATLGGDGVIVSGRSMVMHAGSSTQQAAGREFRRINHEVNRRRLAQLWGPTLRRTRMTGLLSGDPSWGSGPRLAIVRTSNDPGAGWGDYYTALELGQAAEAIGWSVSYMAERDPPAAPLPADLDVAVILTERWDPQLFPASTLVCAWVRNWTDRWLDAPWFDRYDVLLASSSHSRELLSGPTGREVELFPLATNPRRFAPGDIDARPDLDWVFTGNRWGRQRAIEQALDGHHRDRAAIYGRGWDALKPLRRLVRGPLDYDQLPGVYARAKVVLDDAAESTFPYQSVNARVFDALAAGTPVLSSCAEGVRELFGQDFPTWSSAAELDAQLGRLLSKPELRAQLVARYRPEVLREHTYEHRMRTLRRIVSEQNRRLSFCLKVGAPDWEQAERWGDLHYARSLGRALRRLGHRWRLEILPEWDSSEGLMFDVAIHLRGRSHHSPVPGQFNVLWLISHPDDFRPELAEGYDLICVASAMYADQLRERVSAPVRVLEQATDPSIFYRDPDPMLTHELVFVGNSRGVRRQVLDDLLPTGRDLAVWGTGWGGTEVEPHVVDTHMPNEQLRKIYSSAAIVLCDHWPDMRSGGFWSNRIYDALACEALVVSDHVAGTCSAFGDALLTYDEPDQLHELIERLLGDPEERARRTHGAREAILRQSTFDHRAHDLLDWVREGMSQGVPVS